MSQDIYCRLCAMKVENFVNIYDKEGESINLAAKIVQCLQIWLYPEDHLPKTVCTDCCSKVNIFFDFFQISSQSQISLMETFKNKHQEEKNNTNSADEAMDGNDVDHDYDGNSDGGPKEEFLEYTDLAVAEKAMSKRKLRTPIKRSSSNETEEIKPTEKFNLPEQSLKLVEKRERKCKKIPKVQNGLPEEGEKADDKLDEENEDDEPKLIGRASSMAESLASNESLIEMLELKINLRENRLKAEYRHRDLDIQKIRILQKENFLLAFDGYVWKCTDCAEELKTLAELRRHHWNSHNQAAVFACMNCPKTYSRYRSFARHVKLHLEPKKFSCEICGKRFSQKTVLQSHATVHSEERPHPCTVCGKSFKQFSSLYIHSKLHLPDQAKFKFPCSYCPKKFTTKTILETHMKNHTGERNFVCEMCGKRFVNKAGLDYHMLSHSEVRPYTCSVCNKGFKTLRLLNKHSTVHTGVKPHQCDVCGKQFRERGALKEHHRIHSGAMPYSCEFCGKLFRFKGTLTIHRRQHTGERPYSCTDCRREFTNWANYNKHMKRRHRNGENNSVLVTRLSQGQVEEPPTDPASTPALIMHYEPADTATYKVVEEDMYRVTTNYMGYYIPPLQHTRTQ